MKQEYSEYSGLSIEELDLNIGSNQIEQDKDYMWLLKNSKNLIYDSFKVNFNIDKPTLRDKLSLFSPQMISLITNSNYSTFLEYMGGTGILSELIKELSPSMNVTYSNVNSDMYKFFEWRINNYNHDINLLLLDDELQIENNYDVIVSDGNLQFFEEETQIKIVNNLLDKVNKDGILCLLADIAGKESSPLYYDVDIVKIHSILEYSDMVCIYGKNTFSSIWKKMI